jgi:ferritin
MISKEMEQALNRQLNLELYSAYVYAAMASYCDAGNRPGFAAWLKAQAQEEVGHAFKFYGYLNDVGARVTFEAIDKPEVEYGSPLDLFNTVLAHEKEVSKAIKALVAQARREEDYSTENFLGWFIAEQVEEEANATQIIEQLKMIGDNNVAMLMMDRQLGARGGGGH